MASNKSNPPRAESPTEYMKPPPPPPPRFAGFRKYLSRWLPSTPSITSPSQVDLVPPTLSTGDPSRFERVRKYLRDRLWAEPIPSPSPVDSEPPLLTGADIPVMNDLDVGMPIVNHTNDDRYKDNEHTNRVPMHLALASLIFSYYKSHNRFNYFPDNDYILIFEPLNTKLREFYRKHQERRGKLLPRFPSTDYERLDILLGGMREWKDYHKQVEAEINRGATRAAPHEPSVHRNTRELMVADKIIAQLKYLLDKAEARRRKYGGKTKRRHNSGKRRHNSGKRRTHARN